ncbi:MarR family winged helix-turn-helix transcriptional regulator [Candidatus Izemoplasma sp. B36]|uniref:MarR family winged helix-turn-helix transcriptional regulator n=1 Tax=Candidatus Izemoplasma sp. B36 TaxID=3242468 RepID=UPI003555F938
MRRNEYDRAINKYQHRFFDERFRELSISRAEAPFLRKIYKLGDSVKMNDLTSEMIFHKSHATRAINKMEKDGLIIKEKNPDDLRGYVLTLTSLGKETAEKADAIIEEWNNLIESIMTDEDRKILKNLTKKIYHLLREYYNEEDIIGEDSI